MIFCDKADQTQMFNFDMEAGKIVETFKAAKDDKVNDMKHLTNKFKNGQSTTENTFVGVSEKAIFTLDPRINGSVKCA